MSVNIYAFFPNLPAVSAVGVASTIATIFFFIKIWNGKAKFPPGPRGLPVIGAAMLMPNSREWVTYEAWKCQYGDIVGLKVFGQSVVLLNSAELANKLLNSRSAKYSNRPIFSMLDMMGFTSWNVGIMPSDSYHKTCRALYSKSLGESSLDRYNDLRLKQIYKFINHLRELSDDVPVKCRSLNVGIVMKCFYGLDMDQQGSAELVALNDELINQTSLAGSPAAYLVNTFPILKYWPSFLPGSEFKAEAKSGRDLANHAVEKLQRLYYEEGYAQSDSLLSEHMNSEDPVTVSAALAGAATAYAAAVETSTSLLLSFIIAMIHYPEVQKKAWNEIEQLEQLPSLNDRRSGKMPYVEAILLECYRWAPPGAFGLPHFLKSDDTVNDCNLPPNTIVMPNIWSILNDADTYCEPDVFFPERFLPGPSQAPNPRDHVFGYGRRICPGRHFSDANLWLEIAFLLTMFQIEPYTNAAGEVELPSLEFTSGVMRHPVDFKCKMMSRKSKFSAEFDLLQI